MIEKYNEFILEKYSFTEHGNKDEIIYKFTNIDNIEFKVTFFRNISNTYEREYRIVSNMYGEFEEINTNDSISILKTITDITISFINKYQPEEIEINHIPSQKERLKYQHEEDSDFWFTHNTKRALINKRFLEKRIPSNYFYELNGMTSTITKV